MAQFSFTVTVEASTQQEAQELVAYLQGVAQKADRKNLMKVLKSAYANPKKINLAADHL